ncbi:deoxyribonuclease [Rhodococcus sp. 14-2470-1b]|uniref:GmrSD restriction endonuclease domain-containing protein n=1 Tax=Rhodococcus sp. 14-2470-1b TaxID=2023149 RepID=UPI000B9B62BB|nr:DUF1524 domain-containing protein [Rhodococcus sp. 14-2470-1b]OZF42584.1 deoxyribonuclease [Rhodococcus sp. 14-2470-1b]
MPYSGYPPPAPPTSKSRRKWPWIAGAALAGLLVIGVANPMEPTDPAAQEEAVPAASATTLSTPPAAATADATPVLPVAPPATPESMDSPAPAKSAVADAGSAQAALSMLATVPIKGRAPKTGYDRDLFGQAWTDDVDVEFGHNGCDTRNDILRRDLTAVTVKPGSNGCAVQTGTLADAYTAATINFVRGADTSSDVQIDHVVALSNAWQTGAQQLDPATRVNFANDPRNLQAVDGPSNQQKSDGDAATWLPSHKAYRCTYVARQVEVKAAYRLWVTPPEHDAIVRVLGDCGAAATDIESAAPAAPAAPAPAPNPAPASSAAVYKNCGEVRAAGAAPIRAGQPGFSTKFDGDGDGVGCE